VSIFNRRNAALGWVAWAVGKRVLRKKAQGAKSKGVVAVAIAGVVGLVTFSRRRSSED
jgi:hypothetical protein